jgi:hypothetical protein
MSAGGSAVEVDDVTVLDRVVPADLSPVDPLTPESGVVKPLGQLFADERVDVAHGLSSPNREKSGPVGRAVSPQLPEGCQGVVTNGIACWDESEVGIVPRQGMRSSYEEAGPRTDRYHLVDSRTSDRDTELQRLRREQGRRARVRARRRHRARRIRHYDERRFARERADTRDGAPEIHRFLPVTGSRRRTRAPARRRRAVASSPSWTTTVRRRADQEMEAHPATEEAPLAQGPLSRYSNLR